MSKLVLPAVLVGVGVEVWKNRTSVQTKYPLFFDFNRLFKSVNAASSNTSSNLDDPSKPSGSQWWSNWDRREPVSLVRPPTKNATDVELVEYDHALNKATPKASRHIILVRHGQYFDNGRIDKERFLTSLGREQADLTGKRLLSLDLPYTSLTSSTMVRAVETAKHINKHLPDLITDQDPILVEGAPVPPEPPIGSFRPENKFWVDGARIESAFRKYFHRADPTQTEDSFEVIVCHANVIRYFICRSLQFPSESWMRMCLAHGSLTLISIEPNGRVICEMMGDHGHMPTTEQITFS